MPYNYQIINQPGAGQGTIVRTINDMGQIGGDYTQGYPNDPYPQAFVQTQGAPMVSLGEEPYGQHSNGYSLNNAGILAGQSGHYTQTSRGFLWHSDGSYTRIAAPSDGMLTSATGVNDQNAVVGTARFPNATVSQSFTWQNGSFALFSDPGKPSTTATSIDDWGHIVGYWTDGAGNDHPFLDTYGHFQDIHIPGAVSAEAYGISESGNEIVGSYKDSAGHEHGWFDVAGHIHTLDLPGSVATFLYGVNDFGQVAGSFETAQGNPFQGFVATPASEALPGGSMALPWVVQHETGAAHGSLYYDPHVPITPGLATS